MRFDPHSLVFGIVDPSILIDCAQTLRVYNTFEINDFCAALGAPIDEAMPVLNELLKMNAIALNNGKQYSGGTYMPCKTLGQIALASISTGLKRTDADNLLMRVLDRAKKINAQAEDYGRKVTKIAVFGSYLTDKSLLGDLDLAIELQYLSKPDYENGNWMHIEQQENKVVFSYLRLRKPEYISTHTFDELLRLETPYKLVFEADVKIG